MRRAFLFFLSVLLFCGCSRIEKEFYPNGEIKSEITVRNDMKNGEATYYYNNGIVNIHCYYHNDQLDGLYEKFNPEGTRIEATQYKDGIKEGSSVQYYDNGKTAIKMNFINDLPHGEYQEYFENGQIKISGFYENGFYHGEWNYYDYSGLQVGKAEFNRGKGTQIAYFFGTSQQRVLIEFENNLKNGREIYFSKNGDTTRIIYYLNGKIERTVRKSTENAEL